MSLSRVFVVGLDGFELSVADAMIADGRLPTFRKLRETSAFALLDHGPAKRTGLAWEHISSGLTPDEAARWAAVSFDQDTYDVIQQPTNFVPFTSKLGARTVVFDPPYFDLEKTATTQGLVSWGAHDPGVDQTSRPAGLAEEIKTRFGDYPAPEFVYGFVWPSEQKTARMAEALRDATRLRGEITEWLFCERLPDWDLAIMVVSEFHSASEALWHGVDPSHPLHDLPSAGPARQGMEWIYEETDRMLARLMELLPDVRFVIFNLHGMGANDSDVASMSLLAELMYRHSFGKPFMRDQNFATNARGIPLLPADAHWGGAIAKGFPGKASGMQRTLAGLGRAFTGGAAPAENVPSPGRMGWMPATRYQAFWKDMKAFALPSFYDGRIRINLAGRERDGVVSRADYESVVEEIVSVLRACRNPLTGKAVVELIERASEDPLRLSPSQADIVIVWADAPLGFVHPDLGQIGPLPYRRPGGHTGQFGAAYFAGPGLEPADLGTKSAFDIVPTIIEMLGDVPPNRLSGRSMASSFRVPAE